MKMTQMLDPPSPRLTHLITRIGDSRRRRGGGLLVALHLCRLNLLIVSFWLGLPCLRLLCYLLRPD